MSWWLWLRAVESDLYEQKRRAEYPDVGDQLDVIWKQLNYWRLSGQDMIAEADAMLGKILAVKAKYPKPAEKTESKA